MDTATMVLLTVGLGLAVLAVWAWKEWLRFHTDKAWHAKDALADFEDAIKIIERVAPAADKLVALKELGEKERRDYVIDTVAKLLPTLDPDIIKALVEYWVIFTKPSVPVTPVA